MNVTLRPGNAEDAQHCGAICYEAFKTIAEQHNFPPEFPSPEVVSEILARLLVHPDVYAVVAELDGRVVGSNFLHERSTVAGIGPITVDPAVQNRAVGRQLMQHVLARVTQRRFPGVRLVQAAYHNRSLALYARLGFVVREPLSTMQGAPLAVQIPDYTVRPATEHDLDACNQVCVQVHGLDRRYRWNRLALPPPVGRARASPLDEPRRGVTGQRTPLVFPRRRLRDGPEERTRARRPVRRGAPREPEHSNEGVLTPRSGRVLRHDQCALCGEGTEMSLDEIRLLVDR